jgi:3-hydroxyisobutyrate dehydrogenase
MTRAFGTGMALGLIAKDVSIACNLADVLSVRTPMMESCMTTWEAAVEGIGFDADQTEIARIWDEFS